MEELYSDDTLISYIPMQMYGRNSLIVTDKKINYSDELWVTAQN